MTTNTTGGQTAQENWLKANDKITTLLSERNALLASFYKTLGVHPLPNAINLELRRQLKSFCNALIDYVAFGNFEVLEALTKAIESFRNNEPGYIKSLVKCVLSSTNDALDFNDFYSDYINEDGTKKEEKIPEAELKERLSKLLLAMEDRFGVEDELIYRFDKAIKMILKNSDLVRSRKLYIPSASGINPKAKEKYYPSQDGKSSSADPLVRSESQIKKGLDPSASKGKNDKNKSPKKPKT